MYRYEIKDSDSIETKLKKIKSNLKFNLKFAVTGGIVRDNEENKIIRNCVTFGNMVEKIYYLFSQNKNLICELNDSTNITIEREGENIKIQNPDNFKIKIYKVDTDYNKLKDMLRNRSLPSKSDNGFERYYQSDVTKSNSYFLKKSEYDLYSSYYWSAPFCYYKNYMFYCSLDFFLDFSKVSVDGKVPGYTSWGTHQGTNMCKHTDYIFKHVFDKSFDELIEVIMIYNNSKKLYLRIMKFEKVYYIICCNQSI